MKNLKIIIPIFLFVMLIIMSNKLEAAVWITSPTNGQIFNAPSGQTTMSITFTSSCIYDPSTIPFVEWSIDGVVQNSYWGWPSTSITCNVSVGPHTVRAVLYQYTGIFGISAGEDTHTFTILSHGSLSCPVSRYLSAGTQSNSQTSAYISPGSNVSWSLSYNIFNQYWNNSIPTSTSATAQIGSPLNQSLTGTASGNYQGKQDSRSGTYTYTAGGTLTLYASVSIGSNASGGSALATISW